MDRAKLIELAVRCEAATGLDRELDLHIACLLHPDWRGKVWEENLVGYVKHGTQPAYTASIDAAMTLVPEGWDWSVGRIKGDGSFPPFEANLSPEEQPYPVNAEIDTEAWSSALALTAAALRARAQEQSHD